MVVDGSILVKRAQMTDSAKISNLEFVAKTKLSGGNKIGE